MTRTYLTLSLVILGQVVFGQAPIAEIRTMLEANTKILGIHQEDIDEFEISDSYTNQHLGIEHIYLIQKHKGIKFFNGVLNLNIQDGKMLSFGNRWTSQLADKAPDSQPNISASAAIVTAAEDLNIMDAEPALHSKEENEFGQATKYFFTAPTLSEENIIAELVWLKTEDSVLLCWVVEIFEKDDRFIWKVFIDAHSGALLKKENQVIECSFDTESHRHQHVEGHSANVELPAPSSSDSAYKVFPLTIESPNHGERSTVFTPWHDAGVDHPAVTLNWHDDGTTHYTETRGNNVHAYEDINNNNSPGFSPDTANLQFIYPFDPFLPPADNKAAAITNLFYWNNILHDIMYIYGFDEVSGNFQNDNLGRGGIENDYVRAEGLDGGGLNNANFYTPSDGSRPRMQMYLWSPVSGSSPLTINTPENLAGEMYAVESNFSNNNKLEDIGLTTGDIVLVLDDGADTHLACGELSNEDSLSGKIALIDRGDCNFTVKVKKAQDLGAIAAIVINNTNGAPIVMGGTDHSITIPAVMISKANGDDIKNTLEEEVVNASLDEVTDGITPDGDYDNGIIAHEYGHGISIRLTGGPSLVNCLNNEEQMGEGWSDYFGLILTTDWSTAESTDLRGIGTYVLGQPTDGDGIRTYPYTTDMAENPFTYADIANAPGSSSNPSPHYVGSVWCTMLWDMTWAIIDVTEADTDIYHGTGGNNVALSLVINALKLQPCNPGFEDGRDAILLADELLYDGQYKCAIWQAFANRGLGVSADQGNSDDYEDGVEAFDTPEGITISSAPSVAHATEGQEVTFTVEAICGCTAKSDLVISDHLSDDLTYIPGSGGTLNGDIVEFSADTLEVQDTLSFSYRAFVNACSATDTMEMSRDDAEGPDQYSSDQLAGSGTKEWVKDESQYKSPANSWYAEDYDNLSDFALTLDTEVSTNGPVEIKFHHRYETEVNYDGGIVEYSLDNGSTWLDAGPYFVENGYPDMITSNGTDSPIAGQKAFTGDSDAQFGASDLIFSRIILCTDINQGLKIRFRFATDGGVGGGGINGWYVDDIVINQLSGVVNRSFIYEESVLKDSTTYCLRTSPFSGNIVYVDQSAGGGLNGSNWMGAMHHLPMAFAVVGCRDADTVLIAEGTYLPNLADDPEIGFSPEDSTFVFGGFPSGGTAFALRDPITYPVVLSGDIGMPDDTSDNVYHLIQIEPEQDDIHLEGLTLSHANANGAGDNGRGAAVFCEGGLTLENIVMQANFGKMEGRIITNKGANAHLIIKACIIYTPVGDLIPLLNTQSGEVRIEGNTEFKQE